MPSKKKTSGRTLAEIDAELAALQAERDAVRAAEIQGVIARIKEAIQHYGLTAADLGLSAKPGPKAKAQVGKRSAAKRLSGAVKKASIPSEPKYSDGAGKTWTGRGKRPGWFVAALAAGKTADDLMIKPPQ